MNYFSIDLCRKLASLGIKPGDIDSEHRVFYPAKPGQKHVDFAHDIPAYQISDVFSKEALIKLWGEESSINDKTVVAYWCIAWMDHRDRMIEIYSEGNIEKLEAYLLEEL